MGEAARVLDIVDSAISEAVDHGLCHLTSQDEQLDGRSIRVSDRQCLNFSSCSYLGLELDPRVKQGAISAVEKYGTQFSSSRTYVSAPLYEELESLLDQIFDGYALTAPNTTLGHLSVLPVLVGEDDAVLLDHQVHQTVQMAVPQLRQQGTHIEFLRHARLQELEERIRELRRDHQRIWYMADGVYSMYGDLAPMDALAFLLDRYEQLHLYIDDAHGMSWCGKHGRGYALEHLKQHERAVVAVSLNKAFGAAGGAIVFPTEELRRRARTCGGPFIFTGPIQPPMLGAAVASARIHLSPEMPKLQEQLRDRLRFANRRAAELDLPLVSRSEVPIRFVGLGLPPAAFDMTRHLLDNGFYANIATFPAVAARCSGLRFTVTRHHDESDIDALLQTVANRLPESLAASGATRSDVDAVFKLGQRTGESSTRANPAAPASQLTCQHAHSISELDAAEWDALLGSRGSFSAAGLAVLEDCFGGGDKPEDDWSFHYYLVRDIDGHPVLATFFTCALWKDDMVADSGVSKAVEQRRRDDPYFLTSRVFGMGSLLTEGDHLHLDRTRDWKSALKLMLEAATQASEECDASSMALRDLGSDPELAGCLKDEGFISIDAPDSMVLDIDWKDWEENVARLSYRARRFQKRVVAPLDDAYDLELLGVHGRMPDESELQHLHRLYSNVKKRSFEVNTFALPERFFESVLQRKEWEVFTLTLREAQGGDPARAPHAMLVAFVGDEQYVPVVPGLDYRYVKTHGAYRQCIRHVIRRAEAHGCERILFGMGARFEKERFGAVARPRRIYYRAQDRYQHDVLQMIAAQARHESDE